MLADADEMHEIYSMEATIENPNIPPQLVLITPAIARDYQLRSAEARKRNKLAENIEIIAAETEQKASEANVTLNEALKKRIMRQLDDLDSQWKRQPKQRYSIAMAQATLWKLLFPQPKASRSRRDYSPAEPIE